MDEQIILKDSRKLGYSIYGDPDGKPVFYFHGFPSSRIEARDIGEMVKDQNVKIISADRPGYGLSDFMPDRKLLDWPDDVLELADHLGINKFSILGVSGGGPYCAVCAYKIPERIINAGLVCPIGPVVDSIDKEHMSFFNKIILELTKKTPWFVKACLIFSTPFLKYFPGYLLDIMAGDSPECDKEVFKQHDIFELLANATSVAFNNGHKGPFQDLIIYANPWNFDLKDITIPVHIWHGLSDTVVPVSFGEYYASSIKNSIAKYYQNEGHISIVINRFNEIINELMEN